MHATTNAEPRSNRAGTEAASRHPICFDGPAVDFFEGALLGNGGLGAVVTTRPDAIVIRFGHNAVWDVRVAENHREEIGTFRDVFAKVQAIPATLERLEDDEWYRDYLKMARDNYAKPYPRPFPCGSLVLGFDPRRAEVLGHRIDIAGGQCRVDVLVDNQPGFFEIFVDMDQDKLWLRGHGSANQLINRLRLIPDPETPKEFPTYSSGGDLERGEISFRQVLPGLEPEHYDLQMGSARDQAFRLGLRTNAALFRTTRLIRHKIDYSDGPLEAHLTPGVGGQALVVCVTLEHGKVTAVPAQLAADRGNLGDPGGLDDAIFTTAATATARSWHEFWSRSAVQLADQFLEQIWYWNLYFFNCSVRPGVACPGLFANWSYRNIGTAWHGDYHLNYNTQQPFWLPFSSNHIDKHLPYVDLVEFLLPVSKRWAEEYYQLPGAFFPHSSYPVPMTMVAYPLPHWGWEVCETPWTVQSLWWHYRYTMDRQFLRERAYTPLREATLFLVEYMSRAEAHGPQWGDDRYHIFPTVPPELYGLQPGFKFNHDCLVDLTLTKFVMNAFLEACKVLENETTESALIAKVKAILEHFPDYPTAATPTGPVFVSVAGEQPEIVYNVPCSTMTVFPGEEHGLDSPPDEYAVAVNSYRRQRNEGGNELVFSNLIGARLGVLDIERFKRQVRYCMLPNGTCTDKALQVDGRYSDETSFDFMGRMGIWFENSALPMVINECLLQSYNGVLRVFPNWPRHRNAAFSTLRAVGAFLVSAELANAVVKRVEVLSEAGTTLRMHNPWQAAVLVETDGAQTVLDTPLLEIPTRPNQHVVLYQAAPKGGTS